MKVARFHAPGDLRIEDAGEPTPVPGAVPVEIELDPNEGFTYLTWVGIRPRPEP